MRRRDQEGVGSLGAGGFDERALFVDVVRLFRCAVREHAAEAGRDPVGAEPCPDVGRVLSVLGDDHQSVRRA